jgi:hypothetical protein
VRFVRHLQWDCFINFSCLFSKLKIPNWLLIQKHKPFSILVNSKCLGPTPEVNLISDDYQLQKALKNLHQTELLNYIAT